MPVLPLRGRVLVRYRSDPTLQHERLVLCFVGNDVYMSASPDRDLTHARLSAPTMLSVVNVTDDAVLAHLGPLEEMYLFRDSAGGEPEAAEVAELEATAKRCVASARAARGFNDLTVGCYRVLVDAPGFPLGTEVRPQPGDAERHNFGMFCRNEETLMVEYVLNGDEGWQQKREGSDLRTMDVLYDLGSGERFRTMEQVAAESGSRAFDDWPLDGSRDAGWVVQTLRRRNHTFLQHHAAWVSRSGIRDGDRVIHEHGALCRCLHLLCTYDQVRISNLAGAEALVKRMELIEEAYRGRASAPSYEGAEHMLGFRDTMDETLVNPELRKHTAQKMKEEADIHKERRKASEETAHAHRGGGAGGASHQKSGPKGGGKGGGAPPAEK
jgi:hypothetical protein